LIKRGILGMLLVVAFCCCFSQLAFAEDVSFEAYVEQSVVEMGTSFQLTLTLNGVQNISPVAILNT